MKFKGSVHKRIFTREIARCNTKHIPYYFLSALFLLTSSHNLWQRASKHISQFKIDWKAISIRGVSIQDYALYKLAKDIYCDTASINYTDLSDDQIFSDQAMQLVYNAIEIRRYGMSPFKESAERKTKI